MIKYTLSLIILSLIYSSKAHSQTIISGTVKDSAGAAATDMTIIYRKINSLIIAGYTLSDARGNFSLRVTLPDDSIVIIFKHLNFEEKALHIRNETRSYSFILKQKIQKLPDVNVTQAPIYKRKDTINYNVGTFTSKEDRVIGDIIKKLPGIEMNGDQILYQGKPIQKYFINGLDLLEGRYGLANKNLPADAVNKVQIIENDQPIKILDSLIFSDRASLNVQLKKFTTTGSGKVGAGGSPLLRDINLTPMTFNKTFQTINTFQSNNIGNDVSKQLNTLAVENMLDNSEIGDLSGNKPISFVNLQEMSTPGFNENKWLDNNINMLSNNFLQKLKNKLELKGNISYVNDYKQKAGQTYTTLFTPGQTINISEGINNCYNINDIRGNFIVLKNEKNIYLKNNLQINKTWSSDNGNIVRDSTGIVYQQKKVQNFNLSNRFVTTTIWGKQLITFNSIISYAQTPQNLAVTPGQFQNVLNDSIPYQRVSQHVLFSDFSTDHYISFVKGVKRVSFMPKMGILFQSQELQSEINTEHNNVRTKLGKDFTNNLLFLNTQAYINLKSQYRNKTWSIDITTPLKLRKYLVKDTIRAVRNSLTKLTFEPKVLVIYQLSRYWDGSISSGYDKQIGGIQSLYDAYLLTSYSNIQKYNASFTENGNWNNSLGLNYRNPLKAVFAEISYQYSIQQRNNISRNMVDANGFNVIEQAKQHNTSSQHTISGNYSVYLSKIKTILKTTAAISLSQVDYLYNDTIAKMETKGYSGSFGINNTSLKDLSLVYDMKMTYSRSALSGKRLDNIFMTNHVLGVNFFLFDNTAFAINAEYYTTNLKSQTDQLFVDFQCRFSNPRSKINLEIECLNLLDNKTYINLYNSSFSIIRNYYQLRPRQFMASVRFRF